MIIIDYQKLHWYSDWMGFEVGHHDIETVGLYVIADFPEINVYIDVENGRILEVWLEDDELC